MVNISTFSSFIFLKICVFSILKRWHLTKTLKGYWLMNSFSVLFHLTFSSVIAYSLLWLLRHWNTQNIQNSSRGIAVHHNWSVRLDWEILPNLVINQPIWASKRQVHVHQFTKQKLLIASNKTQSCMVRYKTIAYFLMCSFSFKYRSVLLLRPDEFLYALK